MITGGQKAGHLGEGTMSDTRKLSGFEANVEKVDKALDTLSQCIETLTHKLNCTLVPSEPAIGMENKKCESEPVLSEFEHVMRQFSNRINSMIDTVADVTARCTL